MNMFIIASLGGKQMDKRIKSAKPRTVVSRQRNMQENLLLAITMDKRAGGPFSNFLKGWVCFVFLLIQMCVFISLKTPVETGFTMN